MFLSLRAEEFPFPHKLCNEQCGFFLSALMIAMRLATEGEKKAFSEDFLLRE